MDPLLQEYKTTLDHFFSCLDKQALQTLFNECAGSSASFFWTGVGKSGFVAQKIAASLSSIGVQAIDLCPLQALHGDLGRIQAGDHLFLLSKSGKTQELLQLLPHAKAKGAKIIAVVCEPESLLAKQADHAVLLPCRRELCPFDLAPTTSAVLQMIFGDLLLVHLMQAKGLTETHFAANHPSGAIGAKLLLTVEQVMQSKNLPLCHQEEKVVDLLVLLSRCACGALLIVDSKGCLEGVFTDGDLRRALEKEGSQALDQPIGKFMSHSPKVIAPELSALAALRLMEAPPNPVTLLPVLREGKVIGVLKMHDLLNSRI